MYSGKPVLFNLKFSNIYVNAINMYLNNSKYSVKYLSMKTFIHMLTNVGESLSNFIKFTSKSLEQTVETCIRIS